MPVLRGRDCIALAKTSTRWSIGFRPVLRILRTIRPKYACRACEGTVVQAKARPRLIESGMASTALVAWIAAAKFAWGSTLYRQAQILAGHGLRRRPPDIGALDEAGGLDGERPLRVATGVHAWTCALVLRRNAGSDARSGAGSNENMPILGACDGRSILERASPAGGRICLRGRTGQEGDRRATDRVRRRAARRWLCRLRVAGRRQKERQGKSIWRFASFTREDTSSTSIKTTNSPFAKEVVERIAAVYAIEKQIRGLDADQRRAVRQAETKPLMEALKARLEATKDGISRQSTLVGAINYALERWVGLTRFLEDGRLEPDTNIVERSIRPIGIGKKNSLFCGNEGGGETWAILASLLNTCKLQGVDPETYLADILERMVSGATTNNRLHELLVWNWKAEREAQKAAA